MGVLSLSRRLITLLQESNPEIDSISYQTLWVKITATRLFIRPISQEPIQTATPVPENPFVEVPSPHVGTFYSLVALGQNVVSDDVIGHVVAMKLPIDVKASADGIVDTIYPVVTFTGDQQQIGTPVEFGQPLFRIHRPASQGE